MSATSSTVSSTALRPMAMADLTRKLSRPR